MDPRLKYAIIYPSVGVGALAAYLGVLFLSAQTAGILGILFVGFATIAVILAGAGWERGEEEKRAGQ